MEASGEAARVRPLRYELRLAPDLDKRTFRGHVAIDVDIEAPATTIELAAAELEFLETSVVGAEVTGIKHDEENETALLSLSGAVEGRSRVEVAFTGVLNDQMRGFYASEVSETEIIATTQFEAPDARRAFPCFDDPAKKATFAISLEVDNALLALSNMPVTSEKPSDAEGKRIVEFAETPLMSTYLVAFIVGKLEYIGARAPSGVDVRVYTTPGRSEQGRFALDVAVRALEFYAEYFGIEYKLPKMDLVAIPDFATGAMENYGLITFRESALLVDDANSGAATRQWVSMVVTHEIAHQWFGNLVTMQSWKHLWLNEGFAVWMECHCTANLFPEFEMWTQFVNDNVSPALALDSLETTHPIEVDVTHPKDVDEIFDDISYCKGASIVRMVVNMLGDTAFRDGMREYLQRHAFGNAATEDLWSALASVSGVDVGSTMRSWTALPGYPLVTISTQRESDSQTLTIKQERFFADGRTPDTSSLWHIPLRIVAIGDGGVETVFDGIVSDACTTVTAPLDRVILANPNCASLVRVAYAEDLRNQIQSALARGALVNALDRSGVVSDVFATAQAGRGGVSLRDVLQTVDSLRDHERSRVVWRDAADQIGDLDAVFAGHDVYPLFERWVRHLLVPVRDAVGWEPEPDESHETKLLRGTVLSLLGVYGDETTVAEATRRFESGKIDPNLRSAVYRTVAAHGGRSAYKKLQELHEKATLNEEKVRCLRVLGVSGDPALMREALQYAVSPKVRRQDSDYVIQGVASCPHAGGHVLAWEFLRDNFDDLAKKYQSGFLLGRLIRVTLASFASEAAADEFAAFFATKRTEGAKQTIKQVVEDVRTRGRWAQRDLEAGAAWLRERESDIGV